MCLFPISSLLTEQRQPFGGRADHSHLSVIPWPQPFSALRLLTRRPCSHSTTPDHKPRREARSTL